MKLLVGAKGDRFSTVELGPIDFPTLDFIKSLSEPVGVPPIIPPDYYGESVCPHLEFLFKKAFEIDVNISERLLDARPILLNKSRLSTVNWRVQVAQHRTVLASNFRPTPGGQLFSGLSKYEKSFSEKSNYKKLGEEFPDLRSLSNYFMALKFILALTNSKSTLFTIDDLVEGYNKYCSHEKNKTVLPPLVFVEEFLKDYFNKLAPLSYSRLLHIASRLTKDEVTHVRNLHVSDGMLATIVESEKGMAGFEIIEFIDNTPIEWLKKIYAKTGS
jgi:hypothetical protein